MRAGSGLGAFFAFQEAGGYLAELAANLFDDWRLPRWPTAVIVVAPTKQGRIAPNKMPISTSASIKFSSSLARALGRAALRRLPC